MASNSISRKKFITSLGLIGAVAVCPKSTLADDGEYLLLPEGALKVGPYLQNPSQTGITVRWISSKPSFGWVAYGTSPTQLDKIQHKTTDGLVDANNTVHGIDIVGLQANTTYYYRIYSKEINEFKPYKITYGETYTSEVASFRTLKGSDDAIEMLVLNDIHDRPESFGLLLGQHQLNNTDLIFLNGDMFDYQTNEQQLIDHLIKPLTTASKVPFILSRGNHEVRGVFARDIHHYFNGTEQKYYYSFTHGPLYIIVLDSGEDKPDEEAVYAGLVDFDAYRLQQAAWLQSETQKKEFKKAKYRLVFSHIPLYYSGDWHGTMHCRQVWGDIFNKAKIDVLISGHTHKHGIHQAVAGQHNYPIVIGGGPKDNTRTTIKVNADSKALKVTMHNDAGKEIDTLNL